MLDGLNVHTGVVSETVNVAVFDVAEPSEFVTVARYRLLFMAVVTFVSVRVAPVPPLTFDHVLPLLVETCHWYVGEGVPVAVTLKVAFCPAVTV